MIENLKQMGCEVTPCGSRVTCDPPPTDTDQDYLVYCDGEDLLSRVVAVLKADGWEWEGDNEHYQVVAGSGFMSHRKGDVNLIVTSSRVFRDRHMIATRVCQRLNLMDKKDRIAVFQEILYWDSCSTSVTVA